MSKQDHITTVETHRQGLIKTKGNYIRAAIPFAVLTVISFFAFVWATIEGTGALIFITTVLWLMGICGFGGNLKSADWVQGRIDFWNEYLNLIYKGDLINSLVLLLDNDKLENP